jgi:hypothetical protein
MMAAEQELDSINDSTSPIAAHKESVAICESQNPGSTKRNPSKKVMTLCILLAIGGITCGVIGVVYFEKAKQLSSDTNNQNSNKKTEPDTEESGKPQDTSLCALSKEVQKSGKLALWNLINVVQIYLQLHI